MPAVPPLDSRDRKQFLSGLLVRQPGYVPEFILKEGDFGMTLARIFSRYLEIYNEGLNEVPARSLLAFLSLTGSTLLPAQPARAPVVFHLMPNCPVDVPLPANSQVAAPTAPRPVSPLLEDIVPTSGESQSQVFATTSTITLTRAKLAAVYSLDPGQDRFADHTSQLQTGFTFFGDLRPVEHAIYLGQDEAFALAGGAEIRLTFVLGAIGTKNMVRDLDVDWEYLSKDGWFPLKLEHDFTEGFTTDGTIILKKDCGPDAKVEVIHEKTSYWIRGLLKTPLLPHGAEELGEVPVFDIIQARVGFTKTDLQPDSSYLDQAQLDISNNFYPFGTQPARYATFYIANKEAFQRRNARINLNFKFSEPGGTSNASLDWEYYDGNNWFPLDARFEFVDETAAMTKPGSVTFLTPLDWQPVSVNGEKNYWLRVRLNSGDYGQPMKLNVVPDGSSYKVTLVDSTLKPPVVSKLSIDYTYLTNAALLDHCLTYNDFVFEDHSEDSRWLRRAFQPFRPLPDSFPAVYLSFDQALPSGLVSLYLGLDFRTDAPEVDTGLALIWEYETERGWTELSMIDETNGFRESGMIQFIGPIDAIFVPGLGGNLIRVRARLKQGDQWELVAAQGLWLNAVWATQRQVVDGEVLGSSTGMAGQTFNFLRAREPIIEGQWIEVREWVTPDPETGRGEGWQTAVVGVPAKDIRLESDPVSGVTTAAWVRWHESRSLSSANRDSRVYVIERLTGLLRFGDGQHGMIPPAGARILASYSSGGGLEGNVAAGAIHELRTGVPYLMGVSNPAPAFGGADTETIIAVGERGPFRLRHRGRTISPADYEWLAREASPAVARIRCLPLTGPHGHGQTGWVTLVLVPNSRDPRPVPDPELVHQVRSYIGRHAPASIAEQVRVLPPEFIPVSVEAEIVPTQASLAAQVEARVRKELDSFLHPLTGGPNQRGWELGETVHLSQISTVIENTTGVDYAKSVRLRLGTAIFTDYVPVDEISLIVAGDHELKLVLQ